MISRIKGTQDFLDLTLYNFIIHSAQTFFINYHFTEIKTPILESTELFKRSLGLQTDVITKEMFTLHTSKEEDAICLRPETTASTVRAYIENTIQSRPWKVFSIGPMFRHERPQKGRYRQFHQINLEVIGSISIAQDVYLITMLDRFFHEQLHLDNYALIINFLGCPADREKFKIKLATFLQSIQGKLCKDCLVRKEKNILRVFDCKNRTCQKLYEQAPQIVDWLCKECEKEWQQLQDQLSFLSVSFTYKPTLVRGLDYYDKTVFEFVSENLGAQNAFCSGGRYDHLFTQLGHSEDIPSVGAAIGIERVMLLLESIKEDLPLAQPLALQVILPLSSEQHALALFLADELQDKGFAVDVLLEGDSLKSMMRKANKMGAQHALILGPDEQQEHTVTVKNMITGAEERISQVELVEYLRK